MSTVQRQVEISAAFAPGSIRVDCAATPIPAPTRATADVKDLRMALLLFPFVKNASAGEKFHTHRHADT